MPKKRKKLTEFFDSVEVDIKADWSDWHAVKKELYLKRWQQISKKPEGIKRIEK